MKTLKEILLCYWRCLVFTVKTTLMFFAGVMTVSFILSAYAKDLIFIRFFGVPALVGIVVAATVLWIMKLWKWFRREARNLGFVSVSLTISNSDTGASRSFILHMPKEIASMSPSDQANICEAQLRGQF